MCNEAHASFSVTRARDRVILRSVSLRRFSKRKTFTVALLFGCSSFIGACDEGSEGPSDLEFRGGQCATVVTTSTVGTTYKSKGWFPDDGDPWWLEALHKQVEAQTLAMLAGTAAHDDALRKSCPVACEELGMGWKGDGCVLDAVVDLGKPELLDKRKGAKLWSVDVLAEGELGCACE